EPDALEVGSGVDPESGLTLGTPIVMWVRNQDAKSSHYDELQRLYRPSHADYTYDARYGLRFVAGGGRASARETVGRVAAGALAEDLLARTHGVEIVAWVDRVHQVACPPVDPEAITRAQVDRHEVRCPHDDTAARMTEAIEAARRDRDTVGGVLRCVARGVPTGLGEPVFDKLSADLGAAMMSLPASRGFELGEGFAATHMRGSEHNDAFVPDPERRASTDGIRTRTNRSGGIQGGLSNGETIRFAVAFKPVATIFLPQDTVDREGQAAVYTARGRHDPCVLPRAVPMVEAMTAASYSPLCGAAWRGWLDVIDLLLDRGLAADDAADFVVREGADGFDLVHHRAAPALVLAAAYGHAHVVRRLLSAGADASAMDGDGKTALLHARERGHDEIVALLGGADAPAPVSLPALLDASARGDLPEVERMLAGGIDVSAIGDGGRHRGSTALSLAAESGHLDVVERLLQAGADPSQPAACPPLLAAVRGGHQPVVARLLEAGVDLEARDRDGHSALLVAWEQAPAIVSQLLQAGADPNAATDRGETALFSAVTFGDLPRIELLLAHGADPRVSTRDGTTLVQHAR
ncbi:MAG: chorismate synthase, partial [Myxococcales bacterium]|nr:chorismate synthase [Myxococcales bacterium]